jgi:hypothetical protein
VNTPWGVDLKKTRDQAFSTAMNNLVLEVQQLSQLKTTEANTSILTQPSHGHGIRAYAIVAIVGAVIMLGVGIAIAVHMSNTSLPPPPPPPPGFPPAFR